MRTLGKTLVSIGLVVLLGCGGTGPEPKTAKPVVKEEEPVADSAGPKRVELTTGDGLILVGSSYAPEKKEEGKPPGVLLLHQMRGERQDWGDLPGELTGLGYAVLSMDLRGHGESTKGKDGKNYDFRDFVRGEFPAMVDDALVALNFMRRELADPNRLGVVGASIGANAAINAAAEDDSVKSVVLLSPGLEYHLIQAGPALRTYGGAVFLVASEEDRYAADGVRSLHELCMGECEMEMYSDAGHGTNMFAPTGGDLQKRIVEWLDATLKEDGGKSTDETE
jgi:pimeloyl-ACP methyl ester carboxylesterase